MLAGAFDGDLGEHRKIDAVDRAAEVLDLLVAAGLLLAELVGRKAEHREAARRDRLVELLEALILRGLAALRGDVDDEEDLAGEVGERGLGAVDAADGNVVEHGMGLAEERAEMGACCAVKATVGALRRASQIGAGHRAACLAGQGLREAEDPLENRVDVLQVIAEVEERRRAPFSAIAPVTFRVLLEQAQEVAVALPRLHGVALDDGIGVLAADMPSGSAPAARAANG